MTPPARADAVLVLIDCQNEYVSGDLPLVGVDVALDHLTGLLDRAREAGTPVVHIRHKGQPGSLFDLGQSRGAIHPEVAPPEGELVIDKGLPTAFAGPSLQERTGRASSRERARQYVEIPGVAVA